MVRLFDPLDALTDGSFRLSWIAKAPTVTFIHYTHLPEESHTLGMLTNTHSYTHIHVCTNRHREEE